MNNTNSFDWGMVAGMLVLTAANAGNWLITPMKHPDAGPIQRSLAIAQAVICFVAAIWIIRRHRSRHAPQAV
jgi:hypothetical protein